MKLQNQSYLLLTLLVVFTSFLSFGQHGQDWINFDQSYYKIEISENGIYKLDYNSLQNAGLPVNAINPKNFQVYLNGEEQHIYVNGEADNSFDAADFIEFYGKYNDGKLDEVLYRNPSEQPHQYMSLYTDSSCYFLTWTTASPGKRVTNFYDGNYTGKTSDPWIWISSPKWYGPGAIEEYYDGSPYSSPGYYSEYTTGEGWFSQYIANNAPRYLPVNTELYNNAGPTPKYEFSVYGKSNPTGQGAIINGINHEIEVTIANTLIYEKRHYGYSRLTDSGTLDPGLLVDTSTIFRFESVYLTKGRHATSYIRVDYPRFLDMNNKSTFEWKYTGNNSYFKFDQFMGTNAFVYDNTNHQRIQADVNSGSIEFNCSTTGTKELFITDASAITLLDEGAISEQTFNNYDFNNTNYDYVIITNKLLESSTDDYADYRASTVGGAYNVLKVYSSDLYNEYYYGYHHPMAIRNFCRSIFDQQATPPKYILIVGKGQSYFKMRYDYSKRTYEDLVPTWGNPPSDYIFVTDYTPNNLVPQMAIGRVPARKNEEVINYLDKLKVHELYGNTSKTVLQLTGGAGQKEQLLLEGYQNHYYEIIKGQKYGGNREKITKSEAVAVDSSLTADIQAIINDGTSIVSYFGHGASQALEVDMGRAKHLDNYGKYPLFVFNGCTLGNSYEEFSLPEEYLLEKDYGGIAWIASSAFGFINELFSWTSKFYTNILDEHYGESIGQNIIYTMADYQNPADPFNRSQCRQMVFHGDPAIKLFAPTEPDYTFNPEISIFPEDANAEDDSFALALSIVNLGMATVDSPEFVVKVEYSNDSIATFGPKKFGQIHSSLDILFWIPNGPFSTGYHNFTIYIDQGDSIKELSPMGELNNTSTFSYFMPSNRLAILGPRKDAIIPVTEVLCQVQNTNVLAQNDEVYFELDTTPLFNSPALQQSNLVIGSNIISHKFILPPYDSVDFFWRARFNKPLSEGGLWETSTFSLIYESSPGWSQGYYTKLNESNGVKLVMNEETRDLEFLRTISDKYTIYAGGSNISSSKKGIRIEPNYYYPGFLSNGLAAVAVDPDRLDRFKDSSIFNKKFGRKTWGVPGYVTGEYSGAYWFDMRIKEHRDSFVDYMHRVPEGYYMFLYTSGETHVEQWEDTVYQALEMYGALEIRNINDGDPYGLIGKKDWNIGEGTELIANYNSTTDPKDQVLEFSIVLFPIAKSGTLTSQKIGPSSSWKQFYYTLHNTFDSNSDSLHYEILGIDRNNYEIPLFTNIKDPTLDISSIDPEIYPYLKIRGYFEDVDERTPAEQDRWSILYEGVAEGTIDPSIAFYQSHDTIQEGDSIAFKIAYQNISTYDMDSVLVHALNRKSDQSIDTIEMGYYKPLVPQDSFILDYKIATRGLTGLNRFTIFVNPDFDQPEQTLENNVIDLKYVVLNDNKNPLLDVVFDGNHILDYDIVSPNTVITMSVLDDNEFMFIDDPSSFDVTILKPNGQTDTITHNLGEVAFYPGTKPGEKAVMEYAANDLASGDYLLTVVVRDASQNESSELRYKINFKVVRESALSNIYPYPNPFTTSMKFVYTLTGDQVPDYLKIQIMTVSGRIVREVTKEELGLIKIGNNISEFTWDGSDQYGDQLANGVYLYKVVAKIDGEDIDHYDTDGDQFFQHGIGKIYLMR